MNTHPEQWAVINAAAPWEQLGVQCLTQEHLSRGIEGEESAVHSLPRPTIPAGFAKHIIMRIDLVQALQRQLCKGKTFWLGLTLNLNKLQIQLCDIAY